jgi:predicted RNA binding protein YcfA (HicA-like mRNA interferase family)
VSKAVKIFSAAQANPAGLSFSELQRLVEAAGFTLARTRGDHHVYTRPGTVEIINLQPVKGKAKAYQVRQVLGLIEKYAITVE